MTLFKKSLIKEAKEKLKRYNDIGHNGVAIHIQGEGIPILTGPCHGFIRNMGNSDSKAIVSLLKREGDHGPARKQCKGEVVIRYCDWLFNRSPWSLCFKYKAAVNAWKEGSCVLRVDVPANLLQGALICTRNTWEYPQHINLWHSLVTQHGVAEDIAFLASFFVSVRKSTVTPVSMVHDHVGISSRFMTPEGAHAFLTNSPLYKQALYNKKGRYEGVHKAFAGKGALLCDYFKEQFNAYGRESVTKNPFHRAKASQRKNREMAIPHYAMFATEFFGKYRESP